MIPGRRGGRTAKAQVSGRPLSDPDESVRLRRRRWVFALLAGGSITLLMVAAAMFLLAGGLSILEAAMLVLFAANLPWIVVGFWNAVIGFVLLRWCPDPLARVLPLNLAAGTHEGAGSGAMGTRVALVMPIHDEDPDAVFRSLKATLASLDAAGRSRGFDVFVLSDSRDEIIALHEQALFARWQADDPRPQRLHYRRRLDTERFKAGNLNEFCERWGHRYDHMIVLDADSVMTGRAIGRLVDLMAANPRLGILQTLTIGLPSTSAFARLFQFGMRHGMRAYAMGSAWWQGDAGPYWGHNAIIRLQPFIAHCQLPDVPGGPPLGGAVLSHDQLEAVLMHKAGYEVRVLPIEDGSFEANPPTLLDFATRDLRWGLGNLQYLRLLGLAKGHPLGRVQLILAILMYAAAPCWSGIVLLGLAQLMLHAAGVQAAILLPEPSWLPGGETLWTIGLTLFVSFIAIMFAPKLFGLAQALSDPKERQRYGGGIRLFAGGALEFVFACLLSPVVGLSRTIFAAGLLFGGRSSWGAQRRAGHRIGWREAARRLWPQTVVGCVIAVLLAMSNSVVLACAMPFVAGLLLAIPFAVVTASPSLGDWLAAAGWCALPEERSPPPEVQAVCPWLRKPPGKTSPAGALGAEAAAE